ncbi:MAG TPA: DNA replication and repair protein RecF [Polyangiaceae bacterium]|nr:DNA replication and repair protein RecF [Polyangiaceae bacterium]
MGGEATPTEAGDASLFKTQAIRLERARLSNFRNIELALLEPSPRLNLIWGDNGQGKTSVLEALYAVATTRSFRTDKLAQVIRTGAAEARVAASVKEGSFSRELGLAVGPRSRSVVLDGKRPKTLSAYAVRTPIVVFHPRDLELVTGAATERRRLLDRLILYADPPGAEAARRYAEALKERQRLLETRGVTASELGDFENVAAEHGTRFARARAEAAERLLPELLRAFGRVAPSGLLLVPSYVPGGSQNREEFEAELRARRPEDLRRGRASFGPQRDELELQIDGRPARSDASQGQQRLLSLSLKLSELRCVELVRRAHPVLLLDDVSSELDAHRTESVLALLQASEGQIFVTTTRPELFTSGTFSASERADFQASQGRISRV